MITPEGHYLVWLPVETATGRFDPSPDALMVYGDEELGVLADGWEWKVFKLTATEN